MKKNEFECNFKKDLVESVNLLLQNLDDNELFVGMPKIFFKSDNERVVELVNDGFNLKYKGGSKLDQDIICVCHFKKEIEVYDVDYFMGKILMKRKDQNAMLALLKLAKKGEKFDNVAKEFVVLEGGE